MSAAALSVYDDPRSKALDLHRLYETWTTTGTVPRQVRESVAATWERLRASAAPARAPLGRDAVDERRRASPELGAVIPLLERRLLEVAADAASQLVVCDAEGVVLHLRGPASVRRASERLGFVEGACWSEDGVGSNALGTALRDGRAVQLLGPEHTNSAHHGWVCTGAPVHDPRSGRPVGAVTLSGPLVSAHPLTLPLVANAAREADALLAEALGASAQALAAAAGPVDGPHLLLDATGWVARADGLAAHGRVVDPATLHDGATVWAAGVGWTRASARGGGWVLVPCRGRARRIDVDPTTRLAVLDTDAGPHSVRLTGRQLGLLRCLAGHPTGLSGPELAARAYEEPVTAVTLRAELSRLRGVLGDVVGSRPYRLLVPATFGNASA